MPTINSYSTGNLVTERMPGSNLRFGEPRSAVREIEQELNAVITEIDRASRSSFEAGLPGATVAGRIVGSVDEQRLTQLIAKREELRTALIIAKARETQR